MIIWFAITLSSTNNSTVSISGGPDPACMASIAEQLIAQGLPTTHLISIGGWDAPHLPEGFSGEELFGAFSSWNAALPRPFDGFDWDLEGNDDPESPNNLFSVIRKYEVLSDKGTPAKPYPFHSLRAQE